jgi:hypothetical protein
MAMTKVKSLSEDRFTMDITAIDPIAAPHDTSEVGFVESARAENLNVETVTSNPLLPADRKWAIPCRGSCVRKSLWCAPSTTTAKYSRSYPLTA